MSTFVKPENPGTVVTIIGERIQSIPATFAETVAVPIVADWGPLGSERTAEQKVPLQRFEEYEALYGSSDTPGRRAVYQAFKGMGVNGQGGAGAVIPYRMAVAGAAAAFRIFNNTGAAPAITLTAKYKGTLGNSITVAIGPDSRDATRDIVRLLLNGAEVERYVYTKTNITDLAAQINLRSKYVVASAVTSGTALAVTAGQVLQTGNSGDVLDNAAWLAAFEALEFEQFTLIAPYNLTDATTRAAFVEWVRQMSAANRPVMGVIGGLAAETLADALTRSAAINDPDLVNVGVGTYRDSALARDLSTAELAPRIAGILAARGLKSALTFADVADLTVVGATGVQSDELVAAKNGGVTVLARSETGESDLHVNWGVTTFTDKASASRPYEYFSEPRLVRMNHIFIRNIRQYGNSKIVGDLPVGDDARDALRVEGTRLINEMLRDGLLEPGTPGTQIEPPYFRTPVPNDPALRDAVLFEFGWAAAFTANFVIGVGRVR